MLACAFACACAPAAAPAAPAAAAASDAPARPKGSDDTAAWADCLTGIEGGTRADECEAWRLGRTEGRIAGLAAGEADAERATRDGYRARRTVALGLAIVTLLLAGGIAGAAIRRRVGRRKSPAYPELALARIQAEADAIRSLGEGGDALVQHVVERVEDALGSLLAAADGLGQRAGKLAPRSGSATVRAHLDGLCDELDRCLARAERLHVQVTVWQEQSAAAGSAEGSIDKAIDEAMTDLQGAIKEIGA
ncbi:MAG: hypothetical protein R3F39_17040 [Myxococcota bacterium]